MNAQVAMSRIERWRTGAWSFAYRLICKCLLKVPLNVRAMLMRDVVPAVTYFSSLSAEGQKARLWEFARIAQVGLLAPSRLGVFEGDLRDEVIFKRLWLEGTWASDFHEIIIPAVFSVGRGTLIDIGANMGLTSVPVAQRYSVPIIAFEPDPRNCHLLRLNALRNGVDHLVTIEQMALFSQEGQLEFELSGNNLGDHRLRWGDGSRGASGEFQEDRRHTISVKTVTFDWYASGLEFQSPVLVKLDAQGAELEILRGMAGTLNRIDVLVCEFMPYVLSRSSASFEDLYEIFRQFPYAAILDFDHRDARAPLLTLKSVEKVIEHLRIAQTNLSPDNYFDVVLARTDALVKLPG